MMTAHTKKCIPSGMSLYEEIMDALKVVLEPRGEKSRISKQIDTPPNTITRWFSDDPKQKREPSGRNLLAVLESVGAKIVMPGEEMDCPEVLTPEAQRLDEIIAGMRKLNLSDAAIHDAVAAELATLFQKKTEPAETEERRRAS